MIFTDFFIFLFNNFVYIRTKLEISFLKCNILTKFARENMENISSLKHIIGESAKVSVIVHTHPDGDALGSGAAMTIYLRERLGKDVRMIIPDSAPSTVDFIIEGLDVLDASAQPKEAEERISASDLILILDLNAFHRTEQLAGIIAASPAKNSER